MKTKAVFIVLICLAPSLAKAADIIVKRPAHIAPTFNWTGAYLGVEAGINRHKFNFDAPNLLPLDRLFVNKAKNLGFPGLYAGYNISLGQHVILGLDGNVDFPIRSIVKPINIPPSQTPDFYETYEEKALASGRIRLGYAQGRFLPYIASGVSMIYSKATVTFPVFGEKPLKSGFHNHAAWNIGAGVDYAMANNIILRADYSWQKFKKLPLYFVNGNGPLDHLTHGSTQSQQLRFGAAYKF